MRRRGLLIGGVAALLLSFAGAAVQSSVAGASEWWCGHMSDGGQMSRYMSDGGHMSWWADDRSGHMSRWGDDRSGDARIQGARELVVTATDFSFAPAELTVTVGEPVNLTLDNQGRVPHDLVIRELGVHVTANPGREATTGVVIDEPGLFEIVCTFPGHATAGMSGLLEVLSN